MKVRRLDRRWHSSQDKPAGLRRRVFPVNMFIRRLGRDELASRSVSSRGDGRRSNRHRRSSRCPRRDSIRRSRVQSQTLQTRVCEIRREIFREILHRGAHRQRSLHESHRRGSRSAKAAAVTATTTAAASGRHS
jgi:hypothetical protein